MHQEPPVSRRPGGGGGARVGLARSGGRWRGAPSPRAPTSAPTPPRRPLPVTSHDPELPLTPVPDHKGLWGGGHGTAHPCPSGGESVPRLGLRVPSHHVEWVCKDSRAARTPTLPPLPAQPEEALPGRQGAPAHPPCPSCVEAGPGSRRAAVSGGEVTLQLPVCWAQAPGPLLEQGGVRGCVQEGVSRPEPALPTPGPQGGPTEGPRLPWGRGAGALGQQDGTPRGAGRGTGGDWGWDRGGNEAPALLGPLPHLQGSGPGGAPGRS